MSKWPQHTDLEVKHDGNGDQPHRIYQAGLGTRIAILIIGAVATWIVIAFAIALIGWLLLWAWDVVNG